MPLNLFNQDHNEEMLNATCSESAGLNMATSNLHSIEDNFLAV